MQHIDIYNRLDALADKVNDWKEQNNIGKLSSVESLYLSVIAHCSETIDRSVSTILFQPSFCISCFHLNIDVSRRAAFRYLFLEKDNNNTSLLQEIQEVFNEICLELKKQYKDVLYLSGSEHGHIDNTAYDALEQERIDTMNAFDDMIDNDDDGE